MYYAESTCYPEVHNVSLYVHVTKPFRWTYNLENAAKFDCIEECLKEMAKIYVPKLRIRRLSDKKIVLITGSTCEVIKKYV